MPADKAVVEEVPAGSGNAAGPSAKTVRDASRVEGWSIAWMLLAMLAWGVFAFLLFAEYGPESGRYASGKLCQSPFSDPMPEYRDCREDAWRQWPSLMAIAAVATVLTVTAAATTVYAKVLTRLAYGDKAV